MIGALIPIIIPLIDKLIPDADERARILGEMEKAASDEHQAQIGVNQTQAGSSSFFVAGARPAALWACVGMLAYEGILRQIVTWVCVMASTPAPMPIPEPIFDTGMMLLFGLAGVRAVEKVKGVAREAFPGKGR